MHKQSNKIQAIIQRVKEAMEISDADINNAGNETSEQFAARLTKEIVNQISIPILDEEF